MWGRHELGGDWAEKYLQPFANVLVDKIRCDATVTGVVRAGRDRIVDSGRDEQPLPSKSSSPTATRSASLPAPSSMPPASGPPPSPMGADGLSALG